VTCVKLKNGIRLNLSLKAAKKAAFIRAFPGIGWSTRGLSRITSESKEQKAVVEVGRVAGSSKLKIWAQHASKLLVYIFPRGSFLVRLLNLVLICQRIFF
jgi:hypothetical protein